MNKIFFFIFINITVFSFAQTGEEIYTFMNMPSSARQAALGGNALSSWNSDPNMALANPAMMNENMNDQLGINYTTYLADSKIGTLSYVHQFNEYHFFHLGARYVDYGSMKYTDMYGDQIGTFNAQDAAITLGYAYNLSDFFTIGANLSYVTSKIESYTSSAVLADLGVVYHDVDYNTTASFVVRNLGSQLTYYNDKREKLPVQVNLGVSQKFEDAPFELSLSLHDLQKYDISSPVDKNGNDTGFGRKLIDHVSLGVEAFPNSPFNLRAGYNFKRGNELSVADQRSFAGLTFGFGFKVYYFRFDYAYSRYNAAGVSSTFGLRMNLEEMFAPRYTYMY